MKTSFLLTLIILILAGVYWYTTQDTSETLIVSEEIPISPVAIPEGDGTGVSDNLIIGINTADEHGEYLTAYNGMTLYVPTNNDFVCDAECEEEWRPYTVLATDRINVPAIVTGRVGTTTLPDSLLQVTYNDAPLYFSNHDHEYNDVNSIGTDERWSVARP